MKSLLAFVLVAGTSCTTLENRRDLYRSPREGYERWYPQAPPTRLPSSPPTPTGPSSGQPDAHGAINFPDGPASPEERR